MGDWQDWQTNLARASLAVDAGGRLARGRLHGNVAPCYRSLTRYAVVGQAKNRSPVHLLARFRPRRHEMFRLALRKTRHPSQVTPSITTNNTQRLGSTEQIRQKSALW